MYGVKRPHEPRRPWGKVHRAANQWEMMQNIFRMWRDFPSLRFGQFIDNALWFGREAAAQGIERERGGSRASIFNIRDDVLEQVCYRYWVHKSRRRIPPKVRERWQ